MENMKLKFKPDNHYNDNDYDCDGCFAVDAETMGCDPQFCEECFNELSDKSKSIYYRREIRQQIRSSS